MTARIAVDVMSGDGTPVIYLAGVQRALSENPQLHVALVGAPEIFNQRVFADFGTRVEFHPASQVVTMHETPREAIRRKKHSSMRVSIDLVRQQRAAACVSAGNTGALAAMAHFVLKTVPGVERAAIISAIPSLHGHTYMLDLGATTRASALQLTQFGLMGAILARDVYNIEQPRVGLLNMGEEDIKGHDTVRTAHGLLEFSGLNYIGFVEGHDIFSGDVDVVVTDGFTGNVALKAMEGVAGLITARVRKEFNASWSNRLAGYLARSVLQRLQADLDPRRFNGACVVGLTGIVVKSHGSADAYAFARAIHTAEVAVRQRLPLHIAHALEGKGL
jgi:phosphate acyltransferase